MRSRGPSARPPGQRSGCPDRTTRLSCVAVRSSVRPTRSQLPAHLVVVRPPRGPFRGPPCSSAAAVLVRRTSVRRPRLPVPSSAGRTPYPLLRGGAGGGASLPGELRRALLAARRSFSAWPGAWSDLGGRGPVSRSASAAGVASERSARRARRGGSSSPRFPRGTRGFREVSPRVFGRSGRAQDVHSLSSENARSSPCCPQVCAQVTWYMKSSSCAKLGKSSYRRLP